jgi:hypothetical protein
MKRLLGLIARAMGATFITTPQPPRRAITA